MFCMVQPYIAQADGIPKGTLAETETMLFNRESGNHLKIVFKDVHNIFLYSSTSIIYFSDFRNSCIYNNYL